MPDNFCKPLETRESAVKYPYEWAPFIEALKEVENAGKTGYDTHTKTWMPHQSPEGGLPTLGYGHKLKQRDIDNGDLVITGARYPIWGLPDDIVTTLLIEDVKKSYATAMGEWNVLSVSPSTLLDLKYRSVLAAIVFNAGTLRNSKGTLGWPKLFEAIKKQDDAEVREQMLTSYTMPNGIKVKLTKRRDILADAIGLKE